MANKQATLKDKQSNNIIPNTTTAAVADVAKSQALSATLVNTPDKDTLGYESFSTAETYAIGSIVYYQNKLYKFKQLHSAGAWNASHVDPYSVSDIDERVKDADELLGSETLATEAQTVTGAINELNENIEANAQSIEGLEETKANRDGYYSQMTVGGAENLVGGNEMSRVLTHDTAGGSADIATGIARVERVKGNSLVWNQLVNISSHTSRFFGVDYVFSSSDNSIKADGVSTQSTGGFAISTLPSVEVGHKIYMDVQLLSRTGYSNVMIKTYGNSDVYNTSVKSIYTAINNTDSNRRILIYHSTDVELHLHLNLKIVDLTQMFGAGNEPSTVAEFERLFPLDYYDYNKGEIINLLPSGIKTVGFNAYNHSIGKASLLGGNQYQISGTYTSISYTDINGNEETITPDTDGIFTPINNGTLTVVGGNSTNTCVHLVWSGKRNGEYEPYQEFMRTLPNVQHINTDGTITESAEGKTRLFPDGLCRAGNVFDEYTPTVASKRVIVRAFQEGDENSETMTTDGTTTNYALAEPIVVPFPEPINLDYQVNDFGTEQMLPENTSVPTTAPLSMDVVYGLNVVDFVRNAPKNYISKESMTNFLTALGTAMGGTWSMEWNDTTEKYDFEFAATPEPDAEPQA